MYFKKEVKKMHNFCGRKNINPKSDGEKIGEKKRLNTKTRKMINVDY